MTGSFDIEAALLVRADPEEVFAFLADLENHWLIADRFVEVIDLTGPSGARTGGRVRIRGPFGVQRVARTHVDVARPVDEIAGSARIGPVTTARVRWLLRVADRGTEVSLAAKVEHADTRDRLLLTPGRAPLDAPALRGDPPGPRRPRCDRRPARPAHGLADKR